MEGFSQFQQSVFLLYHLVYLVLLVVLVFFLHILSALVGFPPVGSAELLASYVLQGLEGEWEDLLLPLYFLPYVFIDKSLKKSHSLVYCILRFFVKSNFI